MGGSLEMSRNYPRGGEALCGFRTKEQGGAERAALFDHFISNPSSSLMREREHASTWCFLERGDNKKGWI